MLSLLSPAYGSVKKYLGDIYNVNNLLYLCAFRNRTEISVNTMIPTTQETRRSYTPPEVYVYAVHRRLNLIQCASLEQPDGLPLDIIEDEGEL